MAGMAETIGKVAGAAAVGIAVNDVATAPEGKKLDTAGREGSGLAAAWAGGELGAEVGIAGGPWGAAAGGIVGAIGGGRNRDFQWADQSAFSSDQTAGSSAPPVRARVSTRIL